MPHFPTHNPLKKELNLENIYQKLPIGIELYDKEGNLIDTTNEINIREKLHAAEQEQRPALTADQRYSRFLKNRSQHIRHSSEEVRLQRNLRGDLCVHTLKIPDHVRFSFNRDLPSVKLNSDPKRLTQVISNFLTNAIKFTSNGEIKLDYRLKENKIYVSVTDTGIGISEEACKNIFDRFVKLNAHKQGTGLGLSISKSIIEKLGGNIGVCSTLGKGSTFWFTLPLATNGVSDTR